MSDRKKTKKNIHSNIMIPKSTTHTNKKNSKPKNDLIHS